ncbi:hypothetical protein ACFW1A_23795 [Kitasatospora sp. NPDC058965]|uniref:hypothetical protein n=1 Tax=Kitasatospora sp. NPDC058965 TaxID=3346682 RepID=UPI00367E0D2C
MSSLKKRFATAAAVAVAAPMLVIASAGTSSAAGTVTWQTDGNCLGVVLNYPTAQGIEFTDPLWLHGCSAPGYTSVTWQDTNYGSNQWTEKPTADTSMCLTAYYDHSVYLETCKNGGAGNSFERWHEINSGGNWYLQNVATGEYLNASNTVSAHTSTTKQAWH